MAEDDDNKEARFKNEIAEMTDDKRLNKDRRNFLKAAGVSGLASVVALDSTAAQAQAIDSAPASVAPAGPMKAHKLFGSSEGRGQWPESTHYSWFEFPSSDITQLEVWGYTDATSYAAGDTVNLHISTTAKTYALSITRDGATEDIVLEEAELPGQFHATPDDAFYSGPGWPVAHSIKIPSKWRSGGYVVTLKATSEDGTVVEQHAFFIVRASKASSKAIAFVASTSTWQAYNDWGGANFYEGRGGNDIGEIGEGAAVATSTLRPWARGQIRLPEGAPRIPINYDVPMGAAPRYANLEWAYSRGYSKYCAAAGWASYDGNFARWAERNGYELHYFAQDDLHKNANTLDGYKTVVMAGHDEYHNYEERMALDTFVERGGNFARFGGNQCWQTRRENDLLVCYKMRAADLDPVRNDPKRKHLLTSIWDVKGNKWPSAMTWGASGNRGIYGKLGGFSPRASGGYTVYRPKHWALEGSDLYYGDQLGASVNLATFEGDGLTYGFKNGQPFPTGEDGAPDNIEIIAMAVNGTEEENHDNTGSYLYARDGDMFFLAEAIYGESTPKTQAKVRYGSSMIVNMKKGKGEVFNAATTEWAYALKQREPFVEKITRNVLDHFQA